MDLYTHTHMHIACIHTYIHTYIHTHKWLHILTDSTRLNVKRFKITVLFIYLRSIFLNIIIY